MQTDLKIDGGIKAGKLHGIDTGYITTYGTQAAAEFVTKPDNLKDLMSPLQPKTFGRHFDFAGKVSGTSEIKVNGGVPVQISYLTHHVLR